jgi:heat shock protein HtpX
MLMAVLVGTIALLCDSFWRTIRFSRGGKRDKGGAILLVFAILFAILAPLAATIIQYAMSRRREYLADAGGAELTRNPLGLARALEKIAGDRDPLDVRNRGAQHLFIMNPVNPMSATEHGISSLFMTHPPIHKRIEILREMAHSPAA